MSLQNTTKIANRCGLDIKFYTYNENGTIANDAVPVASIDFANEVGLELSSERVWATGGKNHADMIGFKDPYEGTLKISTQVVNTQIMKLAADADVAGTDNKVTFENKSDAKTNYYIIKGDTVWQDEDGVTYTETIIAYKACVKPGYNATYNGSGDPQSLDIEFQLKGNASSKVVDIERADISTSAGA